MGDVVRPNIDRRGRIARAVSGLLCIGIGVMCWAAAWPQTTSYRWAVIVAMIAAGGFQLFEARNSWCVMRACGIKTPK